MFLTQFLVQVQQTAWVVRGVVQLCTQLLLEAAGLGRARLLRGDASEERRPGQPIRGRGSGDHRPMGTLGRLLDPGGIVQVLLIGVFRYHISG